MRALLACVLLAALPALAGCTAPSDGDDAPPATSTSTAPNSSAAPSQPTADSYEITVTGFPTAPVARNATFTFTDHVTGDTVRASDHIGAHYGPVPGPVPSTTVYPTACVHTYGDLPGDYEVTCTAPGTAGTYYLRGHARITTGSNSTVSWWSDELTFTVQ